VTGKSDRDLKSFILLPVPYHLLLIIFYEAAAAFFNVALRLISAPAKTCETGQVFFVS
jgi:hypothetical protein